MRRLLWLCAAALLAAGCKSPLTRAADEGDAAGISALIAAGQDPNREDGAQRTPMYYAVYRGNAPSLRALVKGGARPDPEAVMLALRNNRSDLLQIMAAAGPFDPQSMDTARGKGGALWEIAQQSQRLPEGAQAAPAARAAEPAAAPEPEAKASDVDAPSYKSRAEREDDYAVVVGVEKYPGLPAAEYAERDARAFRAHLLALGLPERNIFVLTGAAATRSGLAKNLETRLPKLVDDKSTVFFYYSGHGAPDPRTGQAYILPVDGDPAFLEDTAYPLSRLYQKLGALPAKRVIVALDSCFSGAGGRSVLAKGARPLVSSVKETPGAGGKIVALTASAGDEISGTRDDQGHGLFTYYLLKGLNEGKRSTADLYRFLKPKVQDEARRENRDQTPALTGQDAPL